MAGAVTVYFHSQIFDVVPPAAELWNSKALGPEFRLAIVWMPC